ncbi:MAG TPA: NAD(P)/FAD-dependent oxidoreductase [Gaiellaceae bacterium]|nr:NAD(P)/FAD-dependent oxidoreductase [Gaiellaceae bacterium]
MPRHVVVLGGGVSGEAFIAALRRLDEEIGITLVEDELVGGECSYWACIPSKTLLRPVEIAFRAKHAHGVEATIDPEQIFWWRDKTAGKDDSSQVKWVEDLGAEVVRGKGVVTEPGRIEVDGRELAYDELMVSTGSLPQVPPIEGLDSVEPWTSRDGTSASEVPESLVVVGGGAVGCELAQFYSRLGAHVTIVQSGDYLLPRMDRDAGDLLGELFAEEGIGLCLNGRAKKVEGGPGAYRLELEGREPLESTHLMVATGRKPNVEGFGLEKLGVELGRGGIEVDDRLRAGEHVWASGDVTGIAQFTHVGKYQGRIAAANIAGRDLVANYDAVPAAVFTDPQVAAVGDTSGENAIVGKWAVEKVSRMSTYQDPKRPGFLKLFADPERKVLVGGVAVGPEAGEWIGQITLAIRAAVPVATLRDTIQPFPTFSEVVYFATRELDL